MVWGDELTPDVADKDVTVHRIFDGKDDILESMKGIAYARTLWDEITSLISYAVGCMFGHYSLDVEGLAYAGGDWDPGKYVTFQPDKDNVIPICNDEYFEDDIVGRFIEFVKTVYGEETLEENLTFVANALGGKGSPREVIREYFLSGFYPDHLIGPSTGFSTAAKRTALRPFATSTVTGRTCWPGSAPTTSTSSRSATAPSSPTLPTPWSRPPPGSG